MKAARIIAGLVALVMVVSCSATPLERGNPRAVEVQAKRSVVVLTFFPTTICSGTVMAKRVILTATHCTEGPPLFTVNQQEVAVVKIISDGNDHSFILLEEDLPQPPARLGQALEQGDTFFLYGNPSGIRMLLRRGYVVGVEPDKVLIDVNVYAGDSGSALFNERGQIAGVMSAVGRSEDFKLGIAFPMAFTDEQKKEAGL